MSFGEIPLPDQTSWMEHLHGLEYRPTAFRLEWMDEAPADLRESSEFLVRVVEETQPDLLQLHQFCHGALPVDVPRVIMAHGDLIELVAGRTRGPTPSTRWLNWYRDMVRSGIAAADAIVAPSTWMLDTVRETSPAMPGAKLSSIPAVTNLLQSLYQRGRFRPRRRAPHQRWQTGFSADAIRTLFSHLHRRLQHTVPVSRIPIRADVKVATKEASVSSFAARKRKPSYELYTAAPPCTPPLPATNRSPSRHWMLPSRVAPSWPMIFQLIASCGETPRSISAPTMPPVSLKSCASSMRTVHYATPTPTAPSPGLAPASPPSA